MGDSGVPTFSEPPPFSLYSASPSTAAPTGSGADPYFYNGGQTVNLSGQKFLLETNSQAPKPANATSSLLNSVSSVVETGYMSARQVVFGDGNGAQSSSSSFSLLSLSYQQIINFVICIGVGFFFMFMAFLFLPMVVFAPQKFTLLFTLGCVSWITGLAMLQGTRNLVNAMMQKERIPFSVGYVASLIGTFYATLFAHSYILTLIFAVAQVATLGAFIVSYFPGGIRVLYMLKDVVVDRAKGAFGRGGDSTILPL